LDPESREQLLLAIDRTPENRLRRAFEALASSVDDIPEGIFRMLASRAPAASGPSTRALPAGTRWDICANCRAEYDATRERLHGECEYHSGILEVNENMSDVVCVLADTNASRRSHPEKFVWTCCDRDGTRKGCEKGTHVPGAGQRRTKRAR
ncbi:hypothetical protein LXA43DRAFT_851811, partial [Ganoderma leucocontextum]